jgi:hypothetical protein
VQQTEQTFGLLEDEVKLLEYSFFSMTEEIDVFYCKEAQKQFFD